MGLTNTGKANSKKALEAWGIRGRRIRRLRLPGLPNEILLLTTRNLFYLILNLMWLTGLRISRSEPWLFYLLEVGNPLKSPVPHFPVCKIGKTTIPHSLTLNEEDGGIKAEKSLQSHLTLALLLSKYAEHTYVCLILSICFV